MKKHPEYLKRMVAAYVIGFSVTKDFLKRNPHLKFATPKRRLPANLILMPHSAAFYPGYVTDCFRELADEGLV